MKRKFELSKLHNLEFCMPYHLICIVYYDWCCAFVCRNHIANAKRQQSHWFKHPNIFHLTYNSEIHDNLRTFVFVFCVQKIVVFDMLKMISFLRFWNCVLFCRKVCDSNVLKKLFICNLYFNFTCTFRFQVCNFLAHKQNFDVSLVCLLGEHFDIYCKLAQWIGCVDIKFMQYS